MHALNVCLQASTARVVWSFSETDPTDPSGSTAMEHDYKGSRSINLLAQSPTRNTMSSLLEDEEFLDIALSNVSSAKLIVWFTKYAFCVIQNVVFVNFLCSYFTYILLYFKNPVT